MAFQTHGSPEGIYVHQMGHVAFAGALGYLFWHTKKSQTHNGTTWKYLQIFCLLMILWNVVTFFGHWAVGILGVEDIEGHDSFDKIVTFPLNFTKIIYLIAKADHLIFAPALFVLMLSLRSFVKREKK